MVSIPKEIKKIIEEYIGHIRTEIPVQKAVLFGSYAKGNFHKDSDIDLAIFSDYFKEMRNIDGIVLLLEKARGYDVDIEPLPFTYDDYMNPQGIVEEIVKNGIEI